MNVIALTVNVKFLHYITSFWWIYWVSLFKNQIAPVSAFYFSRLHRFNLEVDYYNERISTGFIGILAVNKFSEDLNII